MHQPPFSGLLPAAPWSGLAAKLLGLTQIQETYSEVSARSDAPSFPRRLLDFMEVHCRIAPRDLEQIPKVGPCVVVANHPFGLLEAVALTAVLREIRSDARVIANEILHDLPELHDVVIPVDVLHGNARANVAGMRRAIDFVAQGGLLLVFPAGEVAHYHWRERTSTDPTWSATVARVIRLAATKAKTEVETIPIFVPGTNSLLFHAAGMAHRRLRTALLAHEFLNKKKSAVELRVGRAISSDKLLAMASDEERIQYLRWRTYLLADRESFKPRTTRRLLTRPRGKQKVEITAAVPAEALANEIQGLPPDALLERAGDLEVYLTSAEHMPNVLREIGRLREITFRAVGEGTGRALDLDRFDWYYLHLFVWNARKQEIAGAYRLQGSDQTVDLYTRTLFQYEDRFLKAMGPALELGRSFIRPEYQRGFAPLLLLWKGIGKFVARHPRYKLLFGPVSISNQYQAISRELMISFLEKQASLTEWTSLVRARNAPPRLRQRTPGYCRDVDELSEVIADLDPEHAGVPVLLRQYLRLGGKLLGFNTDPEFSNALDGLIVVDLTKTEPKLLDRYLGKQEAAAFLDFHQSVSSSPS